MSPERQTKLIPGRTAEEILKNETLQEIIKETLEINHVPSPRDWDPNKPESGKIILITVETGAYTDVTVDIRGIIFPLIIFSDTPRTLWVVSQYFPRSIDLDDPNWENELTKALEMARENPATFVDYELELGTRISALWPPSV